MVVPYGVYLTINFHAFVIGLSLRNGFWAWRPCFVPKKFRPVGGRRVFPTGMDRMFGTKKLFFPRPAVPQDQKPLYTHAYRHWPLSLDSASFCHFRNSKGG